MALAAKTKKGRSLLLEREVGNLKGLLTSQRSYATTVRNHATMLEIVVNLEEDSKGRGFMPLLQILRKNLQIKHKSNPPMNKKKSQSTI